MITFDFLWRWQCLLLLFDAEAVLGYASTGTDVDVMHQNRGEGQGSLSIGNTLFSFEREVMEWANAHGRDRQAADVLISPCLPMYLADFSYSRPGHPSCPPERVKKLPLLPQNLQDLSTDGTIVHVDTGDLNSFSA